MLESLLQLGSFGTSLFGASQARKEHRDQMNLYNKQLIQAQNQFNAQMDSSIQRRVKDAEQAGIHPLFAMGASVGASPTLSASAGSAPKSRESNAIQNVAQSLGLIAQNRASARRDDAEAAYFNSLTAKNQQEFNSRGRDGVKIFPMGTQSAGDLAAKPVGTGISEEGGYDYYRPQVPMSSRVGVRAGKNPGIIEASLPDGRTVELYDPELGLDEISQIKYIYQRAVHKGADAMMSLHDAIAKAKADTRKWHKQRGLTRGSQ